MRREVSWEILHQIVSVFCKLQLPLIKPSLHFLTLSNQLVSKIIPLLRTCNCFVGKLNLSQNVWSRSTMEINRNVASVRSGHCLDEIHISLNLSKQDTWGVQFWFRLRNNWSVENILADRRKLMGDNWLGGCHMNKWHFFHNLGMKSWVRGWHSKTI